MCKIEPKNLLKTTEREQQTFNFNNSLIIQTTHTKGIENYCCKFMK